MWFLYMYSGSVVGAPGRGAGCQRAGGRGEGRTLVGGGDRRRSDCVVPPGFVRNNALFNKVFGVEGMVRTNVLTTLMNMPIFSVGAALAAHVVVLYLATLPLKLFNLLNVSNRPLSSFIFSFFG